MFKIIMLVKKKAGMSDAEFRSRWHAHSEKVLALQETLHIRGYAKTLPPAGICKTCFIASYLFRKAS